MNVAILYSGGKDSNYAVDYAISKGWNIQYLLSVKPSRKDCYLFHYATVENTPLQAELLGLRHFLTTCDVADTQEEAQLVKAFVQSKQEEYPIEAVMLGGTGLQMTQIKSVQQALRVLGVEVFASHAGLDHEDTFKDMINKGYEIMLTQVASEGLSNWLGKKITKQNYKALEADSKKFGFHIGFEGGYGDTFVLNTPSFKKKLVVHELDKTFDQKEDGTIDPYCGHVVFKKIAIAEKAVVQ